MPASCIPESQRAVYMDSGFTFTLLVTRVKSKYDLFFLPLCTDEVCFWVLRRKLLAELELLDRP